MANRRMFSKVITDSDLFLDMPISSQALYFHLGMQADDDGFVQTQSTMRRIGALPDDLNVLFAKNFLVRFEDGVIVIKDWRINNEIRVDRYKPTHYPEHKKQLKLLPNNQYSLTDGRNLVLPNDNRLDTQVRLGKVSINSSATTATIISQMLHSPLTPEIETTIMKYIHLPIEDITREYVAFSKQKQLEYGVKGWMQWLRREKVPPTVETKPEFWMQE